MQIEACPALDSCTVQDFLGGTEENKSKPESEQPRTSTRDLPLPTFHRHVAMCAVSHKLRERLYRRLRAGEFGERDG
jgi:hypothetical protein